MKPFTLEVPQDPLRQAACGKLMAGDHVPMKMGQTRAEAVATVDLPRQPSDSVNKRAARVVIM